MNEAKWHVVYTMPKAERKVTTVINNMGLEAYLPLHRVVRQWSDRKKTLEVPLFPNYVFVKLNALKRERLYSIKELIRFVSIDKKPVVLCDEEIVNIKRVLGEVVDVHEEEYFQQGMKVRIKYGQFSGLEGTILKKNGNSRLLIKIDGLMKAFSFNISDSVAELIGTKSQHYEIADAMA